MGDIGAFNNDTFATAQYLGTAANDALGNDQSIVVNGEVNNLVRVDDGVDYYAVALEDIDPGAWTDPDVLAQLRERAVRFSIADGETKILDLTVIAPPSH